MSTNAVIAEPVGKEGKAFRGRPLHWDGYPTWAGRIIHAIVKRDGVEKARQVLLHDNTYWSDIDTDNDGTRRPHSDDDRFSAVKGYGIAGPGQGVGQDDWITTNTDWWGGVYAYVIGDTALLIYTSGRPDKVVATVEWSKDNDKVNWQRIEDNA